MMLLFLALNISSFRKKMTFILRQSRKLSYAINQTEELKYVLQLGDNVKRSLEQARKNGIRAGLSPLGYLNVKDENEKKDMTPTIEPLVPKVS